MGDSIQITSKLMGNDGVAAAEVLTTAMNQYGVSLDDPMKASEEMARMMNVMAAAGQAGSAELPAIKTALSECGMAAKAAGVSFEETNAAIQVLDKAGKKGSEGGVALRNVMSTLAQGRFLPKDVQEELTAAGVSITALSDTSKSLEDRLKLLKSVMQDQALFSKLFGKENANAAMALVGGTDALHDFTEAVTGTTSAQDQAAVVMESYAERQARIKARFEDIKISLFQATGDFALWSSTVMEGLVPLSQLAPLLTLVFNGLKLLSTPLGIAFTWMKRIAALAWGTLWSAIQRQLVAARIQMAFLNREIITGKFASNGFMVNIARATMAVARFATVGLWNAIKGMGYYIASLVTGGSASVTFGMMSALSFKVFQKAATSACRAVGVAIMNIPIIGWIAAIIAGLIALFSYLWDKCKGFREFVFLIWEGIKAIFSAVWEVISSVAQKAWGIVVSVWNGVKAVTNGIINGFVAAFNWVKNIALKLWNWIVGIVQKVVGAISSVCQPLVDAFKGAVNAIGGFFSRIFNWVRDKFADMVNWFIGKYNWLAEKLDLAKIQRIAKEKADASWEADHPTNQNTDTDYPIAGANGDGAVDSGAGAPGDLDGDGSGNGDAIADGLGSVGGGKGGESDRIKNVNIVIEKLIDTFTISTTNMAESRERIKDMVAEALMAAVNDVNLAM